MGNIEYKKTLTIKGKIIKEDDVLRIAHLLHSQFRTGDYTKFYLKIKAVSPAMIV